MVSPSPKWGYTSSIIMQPQREDGASGRSCSCQPIQGDLLDSSCYTAQRNCSLQVVPMGSVGLLLVYHIFDIIRERISHMDDGEKDTHGVHASNEKNPGCLGCIGGYTTVKPYNKKLSQSCQTLANFLPGRVPLRNFTRAQTLKAHF